MSHRSAWASGVINLARLVLRLGQVSRMTMDEAGRHESDTTHTVMLAMLGAGMARGAGMDPGLVARFALVHDLHESYSGDVCTARGLTDAQAAEKERSEALAAARVRSDLAAFPELVALVVEYELQEIPEARYVRYLDKLLPKATHILNRGAALRGIGMTEPEMLNSHAEQGAALRLQYPEFGDLAAAFDEICSVAEREVDLGQREGEETREQESPQMSRMARVCYERIYLSHSGGVSYRRYGNGNWDIVSGGEANPADPHISANLEKLYLSTFGTPPTTSDHHNRGAGDWQATAEEINALPPAVRAWVHELDAVADPAGDPRRRVEAEDRIRELEALVAEQDANLKTLATAVLDSWKVGGVGLDTGSVSCRFCECDEDMERNEAHQPWCAVLVADEVTDSEEQRS